MPTCTTEATKSSALPLGDAAVARRMLAVLGD